MKKATKGGKPAYPGAWIKKTKAKEHSAGAIKGLKKFIEEETKEKRNKMTRCKTCGSTAHKKHGK